MKILTIIDTDFYLEDLYKLTSFYFIYVEDHSY